MFFIEQQVAVLAMWTQQGHGYWLSKSTNENDISSTIDKAEQGQTGLVTSDQHDLDPTLPYVLVAIAIVVLTSPIHIFKMVEAVNKPRDWQTYERMMVSFVLIEETLPIVMPLVWLLVMPDLIRRRKQLWSEVVSRLRIFKSCQSSAAAENIDQSVTPPSVTFVQLQD